MSVPASKKSSSAARRRRSHIHVDPVNTGGCSNCGKPVISHRACGECGFYKGRQAIDHSREAERTIKKMQAAPAPEAEEKSAE
jgi:large subunit ribosomal protein L32